MAPDVPFYAPRERGSLNVLRVVLCVFKGGCRGRGGSLRGSDAVRGISSLIVALSSFGTGTNPALVG
jgi:hypothetical protein